MHNIAQPKQECEFKLPSLRSTTEKADVNRVDTVFCTGSIMSVHRLFGLEPPSHTHSLQRERSLS